MGAKEKGNRKGIGIGKKREGKGRGKMDGGGGVEGKGTIKWLGSVREGKK